MAMTSLGNLCSKTGNVHAACKYLDWRNSKGIMEEYIPMESFIVLVFGTKEL